MKKNDLLCLVLRSALWGTPLEFQKMPPEAYRALMNAADKQTVTGLFCHTLIANDVKLNKYDAVESLAQLQQIEERNKQINKALGELCTLLNRHAIKFIVVKGQTLASLYPAPMTRVPGDIDFYCDADNFDKAKKIIEEAWDVSFEDEEDEHGQHIAFNHFDITFELHRKLRTFASKKIQNTFNNLISDSKITFMPIEGQCIPTLEPVSNIFFTFIHLYHHLLEMGVGLRQFCDLAILLHHYKNEIDHQQLLNILEQTGFTKAFRAIATILVDELGLPEDDVPFAISTKDRKYKTYLLKIVFTHGNFGKYGRKHAIRSGMGYYLDSFKSRLTRYRRFYTLAPRESTAMLMKDIRDIPEKFKLMTRKEPLNATK